ncbi:MAG: TetR/AcrR family transcriptional regulator [Deltaproteobacteria bacterium]|nr:TetR/AcrR family transcriptional regulator [Deltaproteobacteria bacterium]
MKKASRSRDRLATADGILRAVGTLIARDGFMALGINAIAREAGVDKVLIYRYFGGMPELLRAFGESEEFWPSASEMLGDDIEALMSMSLAESVALVLINFARALRRRPITLEIMAWEMVERNELTEVLRNVREDVAIRVFNEFGEKLVIADADVAAITTLLSAAVSHLLLRSRDTEMYNTVDIRSDKGWERIERAITVICKQCLLPGGKG